MPPANNSNFVTWKMLSVLVIICMAIITAVAGLSTTADAKIEKTIEKLDEVKVEKDVFEMYMNTQEIYRKEQKEQWTEVNKKLNKALGIK